MSKLFNVIFGIALCMFLTFGLSSCEKNSSQNEKYYGDYHDGYVEGYSDGVADAQQLIGFYVEDDFYEISSNNIKERGLSIEDAVQILRNYADGEPISEAELHNAIWSINKFYYDTCDIVYNIEDYSLD